jgi:hypothetical protein
MLVVNEYDNTRMTKHAGTIAGQPVTVCVECSHEPDTDTNIDEYIWTLSEKDVQAWREDEWRFETLEVNIKVTNADGWSKEATGYLGSVAVWIGKWDLTWEDERWGQTAQDAIEQLGLTFDANDDPFNKLTD